MEETLKMMKTVIEGYEKDKSIKELLEVYKSKQTPNILAYLFVSNFGIIIKVKNLFPLLDEQDVSSFSLQELDKAILNYDFNANCSFVTFFVACLRNRLRTESESLYNHIRFANYNTVDIDACFNLGDGKDITDELEDYNSNLSEKEKEHCNMLLSGYTVKEIANLLNISTTCVYERSKKIGKKLLNSL